MSLLDQIYSLCHQTSVYYSALDDDSEKSLSPPIQQQMLNNQTIKSTKNSLSLSSLIEINKNNKAKYSAQFGNQEELRRYQSLHKMIRILSNKLRKHYYELIVNIQNRQFITKQSYFQPQTIVKKAEKDKIQIGLNSLAMSFEVFVVKKISKQMQQFAFRRMQTWCRKKKAPFIIEEIILRFKNSIFQPQEMLLLAFQKMKKRYLYFAKVQLLGSMLVSSQFMVKLKKIQKMTFLLKLRGYLTFESKSSIKQFQDSETSTNTLNNCKIILKDLKTIIGSSQPLPEGILQTKSFKVLPKTLICNHYIFNLHQCQQESIPVRLSKLHQTKISPAFEDMNDNTCLFMEVPQLMPTNRESLNDKFVSQESQGKSCRSSFVIEASILNTFTTSIDESFKEFDIDNQKPGMDDSEITVSINPHSVRNVKKENQHPKHLLRTSDFNRLLISNPLEIAQKTPKKKSSKDYPSKKSNTPFSLRQAKNNQLIMKKSISGFQIPPQKMSELANRNIQYESQNNQDQEFQQKNKIERIINSIAPISICRVDGINFASKISKSSKKSSKRFSCIGKSSQLKMEASSKPLLIALKVKKKTFNASSLTQRKGERKKSESGLSKCGSSTKIKHQQEEEKTVEGRNSSYLKQGVKDFNAPSMTIGQINTGKITNYRSNTYKAANPVCKTARSSKAQNNRLSTGSNYSRLNLGKKKTKILSIA